MKFKFDSKLQMFLENTLRNPQAETTIEEKELTIKFKNDTEEKFKIYLIKDKNDVFCFKVIYKHNSFYVQIDQQAEAEAKKTLSEITKDENTILDFFLQDSVLLDLDFVDSSSFTNMLKDRKKEINDEKKKKEKEELEGHKDLNSDNSSEKETKVQSLADLSK